MLVCNLLLEVNVYLISLTTNHRADVLASCSGTTVVLLPLFLAPHSCSLPYFSPPSADGYSTEKEHSGEGLSKEESLGFSRLVTDPAVDQL